MKSRNIQIINYLLDHGLNINHHDNANRTTLFYLYGNVDIATLLLDRGIELNTIDNLGNTPLITHILRDTDYAIINLLIDRNANLNIVNNDGQTALQCEIEKIHEIINHGEYNTDVLINLINH
jgi:ankyrin repeat protein